MNLPYQPRRREVSACLKNTHYHHINQPHTSRCVLYPLLVLLSVPSRRSLASPPPNPSPPRSVHSDAAHRVLKIECRIVKCRPRRGGCSPLQKRNDGREVSGCSRRVSSIRKGICYVRTHANVQRTHETFAPIHSLASCKQFSSRYVAAQLGRHDTA